MKTWLITGCSSGFGRRLALAAAKRGDQVIATARNVTAIEGMAETLDHEVRNFGIRVVLVEPSYTRTNLDTNAPQAANRITAYDADRDLVSRAIVRNVQNAAGPDSVAATIVDAAFGEWKMRRPPKGEASLLSKLRRFMPAGPVDASLRKTFGLA